MPPVEHCSILSRTPSLQQACALLRYGYPDLPCKEQTHGQPFRSAAQVITDTLAQKTMEELSGIPKKKIVLLMPWRAGLAFAESFRKQGIDRFYHISARRNEETLQTIVDYEEGDILPQDTVIIADPMLATGNTVLDSVKRIEEKDIPSDRTVVVSLIAAPEGIAAVQNHSAAIRILLGVLDEKLDDKGFIVPGLGDFGDKYFADMNAKETDIFLQELQLPKKAKEKLRQRFALRAEDFQK
ncbi:uracil phosphoribosyltransferase [Candidatus Peregrinibacteria bacterium CG10_big_fil_rev_8_21_14_0_10_49_16]|nr:MAG: uracil phosphoribosyltransferase [Candidatus Peregrinibacteria bacterium CG22_combo_CG10-13_8_21_14_all_49_11]PIR52490.1 MAG: uracil phosphoribosyltransferase [Candidatus Peregrinibacteria bacterium CG10_big_fil_rev_8_21_14_0_10_49_16]